MNKFTALTDDIESVLETCRRVKGQEFADAVKFTFDGMQISRIIGVLTHSAGQCDPTTRPDTDKFGQTGIKILQIMTHDHFAYTTLTDSEVNEAVNMAETLINRIMAAEQKHGNE